MKKVLLSVSILGIVSFANAQTITSADFGNVGDSYQLGTDSDPGTITLGAGGSGQTWNFTTFDTETLDTLQFVDPATLGGADFPGSNIATVSNLGVFYLEKTTSYVRNHGVFTSFGPLTLSVNYVPAQDILQFPANLNDNYSTTSYVSETAFIGIDTNVLGCQVRIDSVWVRRKSVLSVTFDASGTIYLPTDTFANSLRSYSEEHTVDSIYIYAPNAINCVFPPVNIPQGWSFADPQLLTLAGFAGNPVFDTTRIYTWYAQGEKFSVCAIDVDENDNPINARFKSDYAQFSVGVNEPFTIETKLYPNPASDVIRITSEKPLTGTSINVYDINGRILSTSMMNDQGTVQTSHLQNGMYLYMIYDQQNKPVSKGRFVISR